MSRPTQSHEVARKRTKLRLRRQIYHILKSTQQSAQLVAKQGPTMATPSEGPPHPTNLVEMHRRRGAQPFSGPASGAYNSLPQCSKMEVSDMAASASAPCDVTYAFQPQHCDLSRIHQRHSSLQSGAAPGFSGFISKSTSTREIATSPLRSSHVRRTPRDVDVTRTDYLRALTSIVLNHSAAKMSAQLSKKMSALPKKRAVHTSYKSRTFVPRYLQRRTPPFQVPKSSKSSRPSSRAVANDGRAKTNNVAHKRGEVTEPTPRKRSSSSDKSKATDKSLPLCRERRKTPPVLVQCSGEIVTRNCELMKETPQLPSSDVAEISGQIYTKCEEDSPKNPTEVPPILIQCNGETINKRCTQMQTPLSVLNMDEKAESSKSPKSVEKTRVIKRKKSHKTVIGKIGFSKSFFLSKKRARRPEGRRIKAISQNTDQPSTSSASTPSRQVHESHSSKATSSWRDQSDRLDQTSSAKRRVTFNDDRGREVRFRRLRKRRRSKSVSGHALTSKSSKPQKAVDPTRFEETLNHLRYTGNKVKETFLQAEKPLHSKTSPEEQLPGLRQDEHMVSSNPSHTLQTTVIANRCGLAQAQMYPLGYAGTVYDPRNTSPMKREKDLNSSQMKTSKPPEGGNQTAKTNFVNRPRARDYGAEKKSIETCRNDIKRLADATRCFLKYRKNIGASEKTQNVATRGRTNALGTEVTAPPALPPDESAVPVLLPPGTGKVGQRCVELLSNGRQQLQVHNPPAQPTKAPTAGPHATNPTTGSIGKKASSRSRYCSPKRKGDFNKYAPMSKPTKTATHVSDKRRGSIATHHDKKLSSLEVVEQWLHSSATSSQQGDGPEPLPCVEQGMSDTLVRPSTRDIAVMATPRMMRQATHRNRRFSSKKRPSSTNLSPKKTKSKKVSEQDANNLDPNAFRYKSIDAHARCLELLENSSYSLTSEVANELDPLYDRKQPTRNTETRKRKTHAPSTDLVLQRVLQEHTPSSVPQEQAPLAHYVRPGQMIGTAHHSTPNVKFRGHTSTTSQRMRFTSTGPKVPRGKSNKVPSKGTDARAAPFEGTQKVVERSGDSGVVCSTDMQRNAVDRSRRADISAQAFSNPPCSGIIPGDPQSNLTANDDEAKQMEINHATRGEEDKWDKLHSHGNRSSRHGMSFWPKRRISVCCKRLSGVTRRFRAPPWSDSLRKGSSHREQYMTSSGFYDSKQMYNDSLPNVHEYEGTDRENSESKFMNHMSGAQKERMSATMEKLSRITRWNSTNRRGSHSSVSSRKTELSSYSDVSGSTFSDTGKSNNCIPTRGYRTAVLVSNGSKSQGQEVVTTTPSSRDLPRLIVQCTGGTITPQPLPAYPSASEVQKTTERKETGKQEENSLTSEPSHMVVSISWGGTCCSLQCQKAPPETTQVLTLPPVAANIKDSTGNTTMEISSHVTAENDAKRRQKRRPTSPGIAPLKRADASNSKGKAGRPNSRTGTPKTKQHPCVSTVSWAASRRGNLQANAKSGAQFKKDKAAVEVKGSDNSAVAPSRSLRQRSKPTLPGLGVTKTPSSPCRKVSPPLKKNVPLSRSVGPARGQTTRKAVERTGKERTASVQVSETVNASVQVSRQDSALTTSSRKGSSNVGDGKRDRTTSANRQKSAGTSPEDSSKLVEAYVQTSEDPPGNSVKSTLGVENYWQINPLVNNQNVAVSVQTSGMAFPEKADASFQTSVSRMLIPPKLPANLASGERWNSDFFMQTQRYLSNVATVLASQKIKALSRTEEEPPKIPDPPAEVQIILPERKRREATFREDRTERQERTERTERTERGSSSSSRATSTADASIQTPKSSAKPTPKTSSVLIQRTLRDAANLLQRHRSLSAPQAPVAQKRKTLMEEISGMGGPPPWPVRSGPIRECDTPSAAVTSDTTSTSSVISPSESKLTSKKMPGNEKNRNKYSCLDSSKPLVSSEKFKTNGSPPLKRSPNASQCIAGATQNVYGYQRKGGSNSVVGNRVEKVSAPQWKKGDLGNSTSPKGRSINSNRSPVTSPPKGYLNKIHAIGDPIKPPLPPPRKLSTNPTLMASATPNISGQSSKSSHPVPRKLLQILQSRNPNRPKPLVMRRSKKMRSKASNRKGGAGSAQPAKQSVPAADTSAGAGHAGSGSSTPPPKTDPDAGNKDGEAVLQAAKAHKAQDEKAALPQGSASASAQLRSRSTGANAARVRQAPGSLLVVMPRVTDSPPQLRPRPVGL